jgi:hypothetical protein
MNTEESAENKVAIDQLKNEQDNYLKSYMEARNKLIANLQSSNELLKEVQSSLKK